MKSIIALVLFLLTIQSTITATLKVDRFNRHYPLLYSPVPLSIDEFKKNSVLYPIFDTRPIATNGMIKGAYWFSSDGPFEKWAPIFLTNRDPFLIVTDPGKQEIIIGRFRAAGYINVVGYNSFSMDQWVYEKNFPILMTGEQVLKQPNRVHLDVRNPQQWTQYGIIEGAILIPISQLPARVQQVRGKSNIYVNCQLGIRAQLGWSILAKAGISSIVLSEDFTHLAGIGFHIVPV